MQKPTMLPIENSKNIIGSFYQADASAMWIEFQNGGVYCYKEVPYEIYLAFLEAPSKGSFIHQRIKGIFGFFKLENKEEKSKDIA